MRETHTGFKADWMLGGREEKGIQEVWLAESVENLIKCQVLCYRYWNLNFPDFSRMIFFDQHKRLYMVFSVLSVYQ